MQWHNEGRVSLVVHTDISPSNQEWLTFLNSAASHQATARKILVYTRGGSPNGKQRRELEEMLRHSEKLPTAIITQSSLVRAVGVILQFVNPLVRVFAPSDEHKAFEYLGLNASEQRSARARHERLVAVLDEAARAA